MDEEKQTQDIQEETTLQKIIKKILLEHFDIQNILIILSCGVALILSIIYEQKEIATALGGGLVGFLSRNSSGKSQ